MKTLLALLFVVSMGLGQEFKIKPAHSFTFADSTTEIYTYKNGKLIQIWPVSYFDTIATFRDSIQTLKGKLAVAQMRLLKAEVIIRQYREGVRKRQ